MADSRPAILVTGASRGIGRAIARELSRRGPIVGVVRSVADGEALQGELGPDASYVLSDLASPAERQHLVRRLERPVGVFVHAAGLGEHRVFEEGDDALMRRLFEVNVFAAIDLARQCAVSWSESKLEGCIVFVSSTLATRPAPTTSLYAATKGALDSVTRSLALELAPRIRVNAVAPGVIDTDMVRALRDHAEGLSPSEQQLRVVAQLRELASLHPVGRLGSAEEVARAVAFLVENTFATGTILTLDGGLSVASA